MTQGKSTQKLSNELVLDDGTVLKWRHRFQEVAVVPTEEREIPDEKAEGNELFQNTDEKGG